MGKELRFFKCTVCGNMVMKIIESGAPMMCCGRMMQLLEANTSDGAVEKHVPVIESRGSRCGCKLICVKVGAAEHPMEDMHYIQWIVLHTNKGTHEVELKPGDRPEAMFCLTEDEEIIAAYEYCNKHGLYKADK